MGQLALLVLLLGTAACSDGDSPHGDALGQRAKQVLEAGRLPPRRPASSQPSGGWELTVYYTPVERYHHGARRQVTGCPVLDCEHGRNDLGSYPSDFVDAVETEGNGRISSGDHAGQYLNWSYDIGFWIDSVPRDSAGGVLRPWATAAADASTLPRGMSFRVVGCGRLDDGSAVPSALCRRFRNTTWTIVDEFTPGLGGPKHIDLYIGDETGPNFTDSDTYTTLVDGEVQQQPQQ